MAEPVFVRKATGLVREVGLTSAVLFCLLFATQVHGMAFIMPYYWLFGDFSGSLWWGIAIGFAIIFLVNSVYAHFSSAMPRSGGDYIFLGRTIHPLLGFGPNFVWSFVMVWWLPANMVFMSSLLQTFLSLFYSQEALAWTYTLWGSFGLGLVLWVAVALLALNKLTVFLKLNIVTWILSFGILGVLFYYIMSVGGNFSALFNAWSLKYVPSNPDMYHTIINDAVASGFQLNPPPEGLAMSKTLSWASAIAGFFLPYTAAIVWIGGEVKRAESGIRQHIAMEGATILSLVVLLAAGVSWVTVVDPRFMGAFGFLGGVEGLPLGFFYWTFFPAVMPAWFVAVYLAIAVLALIAVQYLCLSLFSRNLFAWSFDRLVPSMFAHVSDRTKQPTTALAAGLVIGLIMALIAFSINIFTYMAAMFLMILVNLVIVCVAGLIFPYVRKEMFEQMPLKARVAGIPVLSIISLMALVLLGWTLSSYFTNSDYIASYGVTQSSIFVCVLLWAIGLALYFTSRAYNKRRGIDLGKAFAQIPPA